jgi:protoporphyrinogen oxidase
MAAAYELAKRDPGISITVFEADRQVGGISRTVEFDGFRVDIGGHRFFTKLPEVQAFWREVLSEDFLRRPRRSRIFYRGRFYDYPLKLTNALSNIGPYESLRIMVSYLKWQLRPRKVEESFEDWVINRFGGRLYMHFFRTYTEKVWGIDPRHIRADWAAQRIKSLTLMGAVKKSLTGRSDAVSLIEEFDYPRLGPGQMWEECAALVEGMGHSVRLRHHVAGLERDGSRIVAASLRHESGEERFEADHFINTMALRDLIECIDPPPPEHVRQAAARLRYRDFLIVALVLDDADPFEDNWIYVHSEDVRVGRIQNFRAWSRDMVPNDHQAAIGMEYFCNEGDDLWQMEDDDLIAFAGCELERIGLSRASLVAKGHVIRQKKAYPVYDGEYQEAVRTISEWLRSLDNLQTVGRNGLHRYNNQDHSMLTGMLAARNLTGERHDLWSVNVERSYHEEMEVGERDRATAG